MAENLPKGTETFRRKIKKVKNGQLDLTVFVISAKRDVAKWQKICQKGQEFVVK